MPRKPRELAKPAKAEKVDFSDTAKRKRGIDPSDFGKEMARVKGEHQLEKQNLLARIATLEEAVAAALHALDDSGRGDAAQALRRVSGHKLKLSLPPPDGPRAA